MKRWLWLIVFAACNRGDDVATLREQANSIERYYTAELDTATRRIQHVVEVSGRVQKGLPGSDEAVRALVDANDKLRETRRLKDTVHKALTTLTTPDKLADLERLVEDERRQYEEALEFINENTSEVESYEANAIRDGLVVSSPAAPPAIYEGAIP